MAKITLKGNPWNTAGELPKAGAKAPSFKLTKTDLSEVTQADFKGKRIVLNIFPSIDTPVCAASVKNFNERAAALKDTVVLCISKDLPFAQKRFCGAEGLEKVLPLSAFRDNNFGKAYGVQIVDGPLAGLFARAVVVLDPQGKVTHTELVGEIGQEPDYEACL
ncbi:MAG: thiol peroxidase [Deltaproteobacteria bacterium]|nr:thiol peroxidase [Deltaproteobacteria bacterium]